VSDAGELANMTRLAPGVYDDGVRGLPVDAGELLEAHGYADTPENRRMLDRVARDMAAEHGLEYGSDQ
jgi:hypothetical protein